MKKRLSCVCKTLSFLMFASLISLSLTACDLNEDAAPASNASEDVNYAAPSESQGEELEIDPSMGNFGIDDVVENQTAGVYLMEADANYLHNLIADSPVQSTSSLTKDDGHSDSVDFAAPGSQVTVVDRSAGDKLVFVGESNTSIMSARPVLESGFGTMANIYNYDEINSSEFDTFNDAKAILSNSGIDLINSGSEDCLLFADSPTSFDWGQYQGTGFAEGTIDVNNPYFVVREMSFSEIESDDDRSYYHNSGYSCPHIQTKSGYFEVDLSGLASGTYHLSTYLHDIPYDEFIIQVL